MTARPTDGTPDDSGLRADGLPADAVRDRARRGTAALFPPGRAYGRTLFGAAPRPAPTAPGSDLLDELRLVPPVFMPRRLEKLIDLAREPMHHDVDLATTVGALHSPLPAYLSAFGSTQVASADLGTAASRQAGRLGIPMVIGENIVPVNGYGRLQSPPSGDTERSLLGRIRAYLDEVPDGTGGVAVQQSTEDADAEVWNLVYSDPCARPLLESGRLAFELKVGQGAKPGLGGMTVLDRAAAARVAEQYTVDDVLGDDGRILRCGSPGTFTEEILRHQIRQMRNNFPRARVWVKLHPGRDVREAAAVAWSAGADAVTVDGAEGGTGWAPLGFLDGVGLPLGECLRRIGRPTAGLLVSGRMWEGTRAAKALALGATAVGLGRAALLAVEEDPDRGLVRLVEALALELRLLISALGKYRADALGYEDVWAAGTGLPHPDPALPAPLGAQP
ncbi:glutamate synthase-related protein [Streptomyces lancefieldiae]|uniref:Glutamate synthase-related protein n=1 Tax=Streptomyces lancefieldiae TaxID=3075520 RepID=A0ABU3AZF0_9ACTN|nr:glutamate synthase-related protein [Streptomyces sp. DSM 40712]MDT0615225.1 glutamate synthase-related protein [Streptomyces sp. DSM 40712]